MEGTEDLVSPIVKFSLRFSALLQMAWKQRMRAGRVILAHISRGISVPQGGEAVLEPMGARLYRQDPHILMKQEAESTARIHVVLSQSPAPNNRTWSVPPPASAFFH